MICLIRFSLDLSQENSNRQSSNRISLLLNEDDLNKDSENRINEDDDEDESMPFVHFGPVSRRVQSPKFQSLEFRPLQSMETESRMQPPTIATIMIRRPMWPSPSSRFDRPPFSPTMALLHALATLSSTRRPNYRQLEQPIRPPNPRVILFVHNTNALNNENSNVENSSENQDQTENDTTMNGVDSVEEPMM